MAEKTSKEKAEELLKKFSTQISAQWERKLLTKEVFFGGTRRSGYPSSVPLVDPPVAKNGQLVLVLVGEDKVPGVVCTLTYAATDGKFDWTYTVAYKGEEGELQTVTVGKESIETC